MNFALTKTPYLKTTFFAWMSRGILLLCKLVTIPLLLKVLQTNEYAALCLLASLEAWFLLLDFGLGASIQNYVSESRALQEHTFLKTALIFSLLVGAVGMTLLFSLHSFCANFILGNLLTPPFYFVFLTTGGFLLLGTIGSIAGRILMAQQKGFIVYLMQGLSSLLSLLFLWMFQHQLTLLSCIFFTIGIQSIFSCLLSFLAFAKIDWKAPIYWKVLHRAKQFCFFSFMAALVLSSDALVAPRTLQAFEIVQYSLLSKLFGLAAFAYSALLQGLWPTCSEKWAIGNGLWVVQKVRYFSLLGVIGAFLFTGSVLVFSTPIQKILGVQLPYEAILFAGLYLAVRVIADFHAMALQSRSDLTTFFYLVPIQAIISLFSQWFLSISFGVIGIFGGLIISYVLTVCWALPRRLSKVKHTACM